MTKKEQLQQELTRLNRLRKNVKKELKNLDNFVGKWWTHEVGDIVFVTHEGCSGSLYGYGIDSFGNWFDRRVEGGFICALNSIAKKYTRESTKAEIEEALIKEAKRRYKAGDVVKCLDGVESEVIGTDFLFNNNNLFLNGERVEGGYWFNTSAKVFANGQWATIIEQDKFSELKEAHRNGAVIEIKWNDGSWKSIKNPSWDERNEYRVKPGEKTKVGDVCKFWDSNEDNYIVGILDSVESGAFPYRMRKGLIWGNARAITKEEAIELLYGHK